MRKQLTGLITQRNALKAIGGADIDSAPPIFLLRNLDHKLMSTAMPSRILTTAPITALLEPKNAMSVSTVLCFQFDFPVQGFIEILQERSPGLRARPTFQGI
ncbi:MAG: hypothetical protein ACXAC5_03130 [Promethearchaeota archaeon]